jgi:hypothetical protein
MREQHDVHASLPEGQAFAQASQKQVRIRTAIDQHGPTLGRDRQDGVALADVQRHDMQLSIRPRGDGQSPKHQQRARRHHARPDEPGRTTLVARGHSIGLAWTP